MTERSSEIFNFKGGQVPKAAFRIFMIIFGYPNPLSKKN